MVIWVLPSQQFKPPLEYKNRYIDSIGIEIYLATREVNLSLITASAATRDTFDTNPVWYHDINDDTDYVITISMIAMMIPILSSSTSPKDSSAAMTIPNDVISHIQSTAVHCSAVRWADMTIQNVSELRSSHDSLNCIFWLTPSIRGGRLEDHIILPN